MTDSTERFSGRVEDYARYRPAYPPELLDLIRREWGLTENTVAADVGSGTGILARFWRVSATRGTVLDGES